MRYCRFATLVGLSSLSMPPYVAGFLPFGGPHYQRNNYLSASVVDEDVSAVDEATNRYIAEIHRFQNLAVEAYKQQHQELLDIAASLKSMQTGHHVTEWEAATTTWSPPPIPPPPATSITFAEIQAPPAITPTTPPPSLSLAGATFQLEEMEDRDTCSTELTLQRDYTVTLGDTDGPLFCQSSGTWSLSTADDSTQLFDMSLTRKFEAGHEARALTDLGEFTFAVDRAYLGSVTRVGDRLAVSGTVHCLDDFFGDKQVGFFNMIDNREESPEDLKFLYGRRRTTG
jgi:hypothetical protein